MEAPAAVRYAIGGVEPRSVVMPEAIGEVPDILAVADRERLGVVPWGGGTQQGFGNPPSRYDIALDFTNLNKVVDYAPADMTVRVEAGITLSALQQVLRRQGQYVAIDAPLPDRATIGGILATAGAGPLRLAYGDRRDQLIGVAVAHPDGLVTHAGGSVVKNVTGYDMGKLYVGSLGTLGVILEATFRLKPLPAITRTMLGRCPSLAVALEVVAALRTSPLQPLALDVIGSEEAEPSGTPAPWVVAVEFGGGAAASERQVRDATVLFTAAGATAQIMEDATGFWASVRDYGRDDEPANLIVKASVLPAQLGAVFEAVATTCAAFEAPPPHIIARAGNGLLYAHWPTAAGGGPAWGKLVAALRQQVVRLGGSLVVEDAPRAARDGMDVFGAPRDSIAIMRSLKQQFDPRAVLNPGRFVGGL